MRCVKILKFVVVILDEWVTLTFLYYYKKIKKKNYWFIESSCLWSMWHSVEMIRVKIEFSLEYFFYLYTIFFLSSLVVRLTHLNIEKYEIWDSNSTTPIMSFVATIWTTFIAHLYTTLLLNQKAVISIINMYFDPFLYNVNMLLMYKK
jgi:hypothetical protein